MQFKWTDVLEVASQLRADPAINWPRIVESASWIVPVGDPPEESVQWQDARKDLRERLPEWVNSELQLDPKKPQRLILVGLIAAAERRVGKAIELLTQN